MEQAYSMEASSPWTHCLLLCAQNSTNWIWALRLHLIYLREVLKLFSN
jgi:hypothetical protein